MVRFDAIQISNCVNFTIFLKRSFSQFNKEEWAGFSVGLVFSKIGWGTRMLYNAFRKALRIGL